MFYRMFSAKDTFITNERLTNTPKTGSNFGACEILHVHKVMQSLTASYAHILTKFDLAEIAPLTGSATNVIYKLRLTDTQHDKTLPYSFDLEVQAVTQDWDEGRGRDVDFFSDLGVANWDKAKSNVWWTTAGASGSGPIVSAHFDTGHENLDVDVTSIVREWLSGNLTNNGFLVRLSSSMEADSSDYYVKMFHGRNTHFHDKRPFLEAQWDDHETDDRNNFYFGVSGTLAMNHVVRGQLVDIPGVTSLNVVITDASGTILSASGSRYTTGKYSVTFALPSASYSGSTFFDTWSNGATTYMVGDFEVDGVQYSPNIQTKRYVVNISNLKDVYDLSESPRLDLFIRPNDYNPARVLTASLDANGTVITRGFYKIINDRTDEVVVPFSTGSLEYTRLSYDERGNYFKLNMNSLSSGNIYRILFLLDADGQTQYIDQSFKFRVV